MLTTRDGGGIVSKELLLSVRGISGQGAAGGCGQVFRVGSAILRSSGYAKAETLQGRQVRILERLRKQASGKLNFIFNRGVGRILRVTHAVENTRRIAQHAAVDVTPQLQANIPVRYEGRDQRAFVERCVHVLLQLLQFPSGVLNLPVQNCAHGA